MSKVDEGQGGRAVLPPVYEGGHGTDMYRKYGEETWGMKESTKVRCKEVLWEERGRYGSRRVHSEGFQRRIRVREMVGFGGRESGWELERRKRG